jgi:hypothetical protein
MGYISIRGIGRCSAIAALLMASACADRNVYSVADVSSNADLRGKSVLVRGCLSVHRHGKAIVDCANDDLGMALDTSGLQGTPGKLQAFRTLVARIGGPGATKQGQVSLSGTYLGSGIGRPDNVFVAREVLDATEVAR